MSLVMYMCNWLPTQGRLDWQTVGWARRATLPNQTVGRTGTHVQLGLPLEGGHVLFLSGNAHRDIYYRKMWVCLFYV